jgi:hypothetical protein
MRDTIYHGEGRMRKSNANGARSSAAPRKAAASEPAFQELLDHLGRLLAREFVALLTKGEINENGKDPQERTQT